MPDLSQRLFSSFVSDNHCVLALDPRCQQWLLRRVLAPVEAAVSDAIRAARTQPRKEGSVAILPIRGAITHRESFYSYYYGDSSCEGITKKLGELLADSGVSTILLHFDSPGGSVYGVDEVGAKIREARKSKRIVAVADPLAASAAYHWYAQADERYVIPSGEVGSIGVYSLHLDYSKWLEDEGISPTFVYAGDHKVEGNAFEPLSEAAKEFEQQRVDEYYDMFLTAVAKGMNVTKEGVRKNFGQGRVFGAKEAVRRGMADGVKTLEETVRSLRKAELSQPDRLSHDHWKWSMGRRKTGFRVE